MAVKKTKPTNGSATQSTSQELNKMQAVRKALTSLGRKAKPLQIQEFARDELGMELDINLINNYKHVITKKRSRKRKARKVAAGKTKAPAASKTAVRQAGSKKDAYSLQDLETVKELTNRLGAKSVHSLIDVLEG